MEWIEECPYRMKDLLEDEHFDEDERFSWQDCDDEVEADMRDYELEDLFEELMK